MSEPAKAAMSRSRGLSENVSSVPLRGNPIRIVHLIGQLGVGGSERQLLLLLRHVDRERFDNHLVVFNHSFYGELHKEFEKLGVAVITVPASCRHLGSRMLFLYRVFRRLKPDIVHSWTAHDNPYAGIVGRLAGVRGRLGSLRTTVHSTLMDNLSRITRWLSLYAVAELVVNSEKGAQELLQQGIPDRRIRVLLNCVPPAPSERQPAANLAETGIRESDRVVGLIGNLREVKNQLFFVDAMARVLPDLAELRVLLIGQPLPSEPDFPRRIQERIDQHSMPHRFVLTGFRSDVPALLRRMEICCLTSRSEGMPNVLLEAMAASRPVVAIRVGGVPELVRDGETGILVEPGDLPGFASAVTRLLQDPELARRMGLSGGEQASRNHSCVGAAGRLEDIYRTALNGRSRHRAGR